MADEMETKPEPMTLYILRRRYRAALAYAAMDSGAWALAAGLTVQHLNAVLRGERPMTEELREKLETFIREQFRLMLEERNADKIADVIIQADAAAFAELVARAMAKYLENVGSIDIDASETEDSRTIAKQLSEWIALLARQDLERETLEREELGG